MWFEEATKIMFMIERFLRHFYSFIVYTPKSDVIFVYPNYGIAWGVLD